jgi:phosphoglycolate phosphatase
MEKNTTGNNRSPKTSEADTPSKIGLPAKSKSVAIFDFDGTLADSMVAFIRIFERMTKRPEVYSDVEIQRFRGMTALHIVRELRIKPWRMPWMLARGRAMMRRQAGELDTFEGMEETLRQLHIAGVPMYIISSNSPSNIRKLLRAQGWDEYFLKVYGNVGIFGKAKMLRKVIARNELDREHVYYIGDEGRDIEAAKLVGVKSVAVSWGFNSAILLERHDPDKLVKKPVELLTIL